MFRKIENKLSKFAIPNLTNYLVFLLVLGFFINVANPDIYGKYLALDFAKIAHGEVWRLVSYLLYNSRDFSVLGVLFFVFSIVFYSFIGRGLDMIWGKFWFNAYIVGGLLFNFIGSFIIYLITGVTVSEGLNPILQTMFLAFAFLFPDFKINLYMIIPIKMKWLGILYGAIDVFRIITYFLMGGVLGIGLGIQGILSLLNFVLFFLVTRDRQKNLNSLLKNFGSTISQAIKKEQELAKPNTTASNLKEKKIMDDNPAKVEKAYHRCCICGRTELDAPELEFRYCSKCDGEHEYCSDHIKDHIHIKPKGEA